MSLEDTETVPEVPAERVTLNSSTAGHIDLPGWLVSRLNKTRAFGSNVLPNYNWRQLAISLRDALMDQRGRHRQDMRAFKARVAEKALEYAIRYEWCDEVKTCLAELDIELDRPGLTAEVQVTYRIDGQIGFNHLTTVSRDGATFIMRHLHVPSLLVEPESAEQKTFTIAGGMADPVKVEVVSYELHTRTADSP